MVSADNVHDSEDNNVRFRDYVKSVGPAAVVAAGIVGPGTVTAFTVAGADFQYAAIWIVVIAAIATYIFQAPAAKLFSVSELTLMQATRQYISKLVAVAMFGAAFIGAIAFQAGNFIGAGLALNYLVPGISVGLSATIATALAIAITWVGIYRLLENIMRAIIVLMVAAFLITAFASGPSGSSIILDGFSFSTLGGDWMLIGALLATTVPPTVALAYSTFLKKKQQSNQIPNARRLKLSLFDLRLNTALVGLIGVGIVVTAGTVIYPTGRTVESAADMAYQLTPLLGRFAGVLFALGIFSAGISSGLYHASLQPSLFNESLGRDDIANSLTSRTLSLIVLVVPLFFVWLFGSSPVALIVTAQAVNAVVLPLVVVVILVLTNKAAVFGAQRFGLWRSVPLGVVAALTIALGIRVFIGFF